MSLRRNNGPARSAPVEAALKRLHEHLHDRDLRVTRVREALVRAALTRKGHFRAEDLVREARLKGIRASKATVYRALPLLVECGLLQPTIVSGENRRYEAVFGRPHHDHLICERCGAIVEFQFEAFEVLQEEVAAKYGFSLTGHFHELIGLCPSCRRRPKESRSREAPSGRGRAARRREERRAAPTGDT